MNRLQVGDECYVRRFSTGEIFRCKYIGGKNYGTESIWSHEAVPISFAHGITCLAIGRGSLNRLVYPFPCVKELAI